VTPRRLVIEADGGARGNPGPAGYGAVVRDRATGEVLAERSESIGRASNNVAEYRGLIAGLRAAVDLGGGDVEVRLDSKLLVEQMSGRWKVKHPDMIALSREAAGLVRQLGAVRFSWIPRARNAHADRLANEAMDAAAGQRTSGPSAGRPADPYAGAGAGAAGEPVTRPASQLVGWSAPEGDPTTTLLLRHGQTPMSAEKRFSGRGEPEPELTPTGLRQAQALAARMAASDGAAHLVCSPLRRARQTADVVAEAIGVAVTEDAGLAETDFGEWEGHTFEEVRRRWPAELEAWLCSVDVAPPGGESFAHTAERVLAARDRIVSAYPAVTVAVVSHVTPIKSLLRHALDAPPQALYRIHLDLTGISEVAWYPSGPSVVRRMNDTAHLSASSR